MSYSTSDLATAARTTTRGIHIWASKGLFGEVQRDENGARVFSEADLQRARVIAAAQMAGLSLSIIQAAKGVHLREDIHRAIDFLVGVRDSIPTDFDL